MALSRQEEIDALEQSVYGGGAVSAPTAPAVSSRQEEIDALAASIYGQQAPTQAPTQYGFGASVKRGVGQIVGGVGTTLEDIGVRNGLDEYGTDLVNRNQPLVQDFSGIAKNPGMFAKEALGSVGAQGLATVGESMLGRYIGGIIGTGLAGPVGTAIGQQAGAWAAPALATFAQTYGGMRQQQQAQGIDDKGRAVINAIPSTAIEMVSGLNPLISNTIGRGLDATAKQIAANMSKEGIKSIWKYGAKQGAKSAIQEGSEELLQQPLDVLGSGGDMAAAFSPESLKEGAFGAVTAAVGSFPIGAGGHMMTANAVNNIINRQNTEEQNKVNSEAQAKRQAEQTALREQEAFAARTKQEQTAAERETLLTATPDIVTPIRMVDIAKNKDVKGTINANTTFAEVNAIAEALARGEDLTTTQNAIKTTETKAKLDALIAQRDDPLVTKKPTPEAIAKLELKLTKLQENATAKDKKLTTLEIAKLAAADKTPEEFKAATKALDDYKLQKEQLRTKQLDVFTKLRDDMAAIREKAAVVAEAKIQEQAAADVAAAEALAQQPDVATAAPKAKTKQAPVLEQPSTVPLPANVAPVVEPAPAPVANTIQSLAARIAPDRKVTDNSEAGKVLGKIAEAINTGVLTEEEANDAMQTFSLKGKGYIAKTNEALTAAIAAKQQPPVIEQPPAVEQPPETPAVAPKMKTVATSLADLGKVIRQNDQIDADEAAAERQQAPFEKSVNENVGKYNAAVAEIAKEKSPDIAKAAENRIIADASLLTKSEKAPDYLGLIRAFDDEDAYDSPNNVQAVAAYYSLVTDSAVSNKRGQTAKTVLKALWPEERAAMNHRLRHQLRIHAQNAQIREAIDIILKQEYDQILNELTSKTEKKEKTTREASRSTVDIQEEKAQMALQEIRNELRTLEQEIEDETITGQRDLDMPSDIEDYSMAALGEARNLSGAMAYLGKILGNEAGFSVQGFVRGDKEAYGMYSRARKIISLAVNVKGMLSTAAHEGFHYLEDYALTKEQLFMLTTNLKKGSKLYKQLMGVASRIDIQQDTNISDIIANSDREARAYAFQMWKAGDLKTSKFPAITKIFNKLNDIVNQVRVAFGLESNFYTPEQLFAAIDRGEFAAGTLARQRELLDLRRKSYGGVVPGSPELSMAVSPSLQESVDASGRTVENLNAVSARVLGQGGGAGQSAARFYNVGFADTMRVAEDALRRGAVKYIATPLQNSFNSYGYGKFFNEVRKIQQVVGEITTKAWGFVEQDWVKHQQFWGAVQRATLGTVTEKMQQLENASEFLAYRNNSELTEEEMATDPRAIAAKAQPWYKYYEQYRTAINYLLDTMDTVYLANEARGVLSGAIDRDELNERIKKRLDHTKALKDKGYIPNRRYGNFVVGVYARAVQKGENDTSSQGRIMRMHFESQLEAEAARKELLAEFGENNDAIRVTDVRTEDKSAVSEDARYGLGSLVQFESMALRAGIQLTPEMKTRLAAVYEKADSMLQNRLAKRENVPGESRDLLRVLAEFTNYVAHKSARDTLSTRIDAALNREKPLFREEVQRLNDLRAQFSWATDSGMAEESVRNTILTRDGVAYADILIELAQYNELQRLQAHGFAGWKGGVQDAEQERLFVQDALSEDQAIQLNRKEPINNGFYHGEAVKLMDYLDQPQSSGLATFRALTAANFLGGSITGALLNVSAIPVMLVPYLTKYAGARAYSISLKHLKSSSAEILNPFNRQSFMQRLLNNDTEAVEAMIRDNRLPKGMGKNVAQALLRAFREGIISDNQIFELLGVSRNGLQAKSVITQKAMNAWMVFYRGAELVNRVTAFRAAYEIGGTMGVEGKVLSGNDLYEFAKQAVDQTQFIYNPSNRNPIARSSDVGLTVMTFRAFPIMATELLLRMDKPQAALMLGTLMLAGGTDALPYKEDIADIVDTVSQRIFGQPFNSNIALRKLYKDASEAVAGVDLSTMMMSGVLDSLTGASIGARMGMGNIIPGTRAFAAGAKFGDTVEEIMGVAGAETHAWFNGISSLLQGDVGDAAKNASPAVVRRWIQAAEAMQTGKITDKNGNLVVDNITKSEIAGLIAGASLTRSSQKYGLQRAQTNMTAFVTEYKTGLRNNLIDAIANGDDDRREELIGEVMSWNENNPTLPIKLTMSSIRTGLKNRQLGITERSLNSMPKELRSQAYEYYDEYGDEIDE